MIGKCDFSNNDNYNMLGYSMYLAAKLLTKDSTLPKRTIGKNCRHDSPNVQTSSGIPQC